MVDNSKQYTTSQSDTWDAILYKLHGSGAEKEMHKLIAANPEHRLTVFFPAGVVLQLPEIETPYVSQPKPPWQEQ